jgi:hypothetical protein
MSVTSIPAWQAALLALLMFLPGVVHADTQTEDSIKAGFIFNFAKYVEWPAKTVKDGKLRVCSLSSEPLSGNLVKLQGRVIQEREIQVYTSVAPDEWRNCHVLFISAGDSQRVETVLRAVAKAPVLTVSDSIDFTHSGGIIGLKLHIGRIRFNINHGVANKAGLIISSQLLKLAEEVLP